MLKLLRKLVCSNRWMGMTGTTGFALGEAYLPEVRTRLSRMYHPRTGSWSDWLRRSAPDDEGGDITLDISQLAPEYQLDGFTIVSAVGSISWLQALDVSFADEYYMLHTRFGRLRAQRMHIGVDGMLKSAIAFTSRFGDVPIFMKGWVGAPVGEQADPRTVARVIDGVTRIRTLERGDADRWFVEHLAKPPLAEAEPLAEKQRLLI